MIALSDHCIFNNVLSPEQLPNLSAPQRPHPLRPTSKAPSHSTSIALKDPMEQLLSEVHFISEQQNQLQSQFIIVQDHFISQQQCHFYQQH